MADGEGFRHLNCFAILRCHDGSQIGIILITIPTTIASSAADLHRAVRISPRPVINNKEAPQGGFFIVNGGRGGIRTLGSFHYDSFQDCSDKPLWHPSTQYCTGSGVK